MSHLSKILILIFLHHFLITSKCFILMQTSIQLDNWLQSYDKFVNAKEFEHCFCLYLKNNTSDIRLVPLDHVIYVYTCITLAGRFLPINHSLLSRAYRMPTWYCHKEFHSIPMSMEWQLGLCYTAVRYDTTGPHTVCFTICIHPYYTAWTTSTRRGWFGGWKLNVKYDVVLSVSFQT